MRYRDRAFRGFWLLLVALLFWFGYGATPAWGAFTADVVSGFETGDLTEFSSTSGSPSVTTLAARTGERGLRIPAGTDRAVIELLQAQAENAKYITGVCFRAADATPSISLDFIAGQTAGALNMWRLQLQTDGTVDLLDSTNAKVISTSSSLSDATWYCFEVYIEAKNGSAAAEIFLDGTSVGTTASADFYTGASHTRLSMGGGSGGSSLDFDDLYAFDSVTGSSDRCSVDSSRLCEVFWFSGGPASASPDDSPTGSDLDSGQWSNLSQMPLNASSGAEYSTSAGVYGSVTANDAGTGSCSGGPSGCSEFDGTSVSALWGLYAERSGGSSTTFYQVYGDEAYPTDPTSVQVSLTQSPQYFSVATASADDLPSSSEYCWMGLRKLSGGQDFEAWEHWCYVLHLPPAATGGDELMVISP